jgi:hypothetical protein
MATRVETAKGTVEDTQKHYFRVTDRVPEQVWYWAALGSIIVSASLFLMGKRDWSMFVGQWPPTFLLFGLFHHMLRPSNSSLRFDHFNDESTWRTGSQ